MQAIKWSMTLETAKNLSIMWAKAHMGAFAAASFFSSSFASHSLT